MSVLLDTSVAIPLVDGDESYWTLARDIGPVIALSAVSRVELENGVYRSPRWRALRRSALDTFLSQIVTLEFGDSEIAAYRAIVEQVGHSRRKTLDRMIGATARVHDLAVVTANPGDFRDIPGLRTIAWPAIAA